MISGRGAKMQRLAEITNFGETVFADENIGRFEVNMYDILLMKEQ